MAIAIKIENLSKQYRLGLVSTSTLSHDLNRWWQVNIRGKEDPYLKIGEINDRAVKGESDYVWALKDINLEVQEGQVLGIIGKNGAGKSTLLKILSKVTAPTTGIIKARGRIASLLEVGTGFHSEMTGRENVYLNGSIMGMTKSEITRKLDEIVDFAGVEKYIDTPVKRYSSGMVVRLGFSIAAHLEPEILVVDEVLAVGDAEFQKKAIGKMQDVSRSEGRTVLFVSHNMGAVKGLCNKALLLKNGETLEEGDVQKITSLYLQGDAGISGEFEIGKLSSSEELVLTKVLFKNRYDKTTNEFQIGDDLKIELYYSTERRIESPFFWISIESQFGALFAANSLIDGIHPKYIEGEGKISCVFKDIYLYPQTYHLWAGARASDGHTFLTTSKEIGFFHIVTKVSEIGLNGILAEVLAPNSSPMVIPYEWIFNNGEIHKFNLTDHVK